MLSGNFRRAVTLGRRYSQRLKPLVPRSLSRMNPPMKASLAHFAMVLRATKPESSFRHSIGAARARWPVKGPAKPVSWPKLLAESAGPHGKADGEAFRTTSAGWLQAIKQRASREAEAIRRRDSHGTHPIADGSPISSSKAVPGVRSRKDPSEAARRWPRQR